MGRIRRHNRSSAFHEYLQAGQKKGFQEMLLFIANSILVCLNLYTVYRGNKIAETKLSSVLWKTSAYAVCLMEQFSQKTS